MRLSLLRAHALIFTLIVCAAATGSLAQTAGGNRGTPGRPPTRGPESGLLGGKGPTTKPGSHESSAKDERDRIAGKFPAPKEKSSDEEERRAASARGYAYVDAVALDGDRQALRLTRDDFRVVVDGAPRRLISIHYVFRGHDAMAAGRSLALGPGVIAHADEVRTIVVLVDETSFHAGAEKTMAASLEHVLQVIGPADRAAVLTLPQPGPLKFATTRADLVGSVARIAGRGAASEAAPDILDPLARVLRDLVKLEGPKSIVLVQAASAAQPRPVSETAAAGVEAGRQNAVLEAAAASRSVLHIVTTGASPADSFDNNYLHTLARSTGGTVTRLTGASHDVAPLAGALLGGYLLEIEARDIDRNGGSHALAVTSSARGIRVLAARRWVPRLDAMPLPVMKAKP